MADHEHDDRQQQPPSTTATTSGDASALDVDKLSRSLEAQLAGEEEFTIKEDMSDLEKEFFADMENPQTQLNLACYLIRHPARDKKLRGLYMLYRLDHGGRIDKRVLTFYLGVANYRLHFWSEATRFAGMMLALEPHNRQALAFQSLVERRSKRRYLCRVNGSSESDLAFNRLLELVRPGDRVLLFTDVESSQVERTVDPGYSDTPSIRDERVETIGSNIQERYRRVLDARQVEYDCIIEEGDARQIITDFVKQEHIDTILVGLEAAASGGILARLRPAHALAEHLLHHTSCDVMVLKPPPATHTDDEVSEILSQLS